MVVGRLEDELELVVALFAQPKAKAERQTKKTKYFKILTESPPD